MTASEDEILARVTLDKLHVVPCSRHFFHEIHSPRWSVGEVVRRESEVLHCTLVEYRCGDGKHVARLALVASVVALAVAFVQSAASEFHCCYRVAQHRMDSAESGLDVVLVLTEVEVLACTHCLRRYEVWEHSFPAAWQSASVEDDHQPVLVGVGKDVFVELHGLLLVASHEVNLQSLDASLLQPFHLLAALNDSVQFVFRSLRRVVPITV